MLKYKNYSNVLHSEDNLKEIIQSELFSVSPAEYGCAINNVMR
jgi:hypothetical protein